MADELDIFGQPVQYDIGQNVLYDEGADDRTITNANDFAATYKNKEQFEGVEAAAEWARSQGLEYGIDASRVDAFLQNETYVPGAYLNNEVDFTVGGYDTDLETDTEETEVSLDQISEAENDTTEVNQEDSDTTNN